MKKLLLSIATLLAGGTAALAGPVPEFPGGDEVLQKFLEKNIVYPAQPAEMGIEGVVGVVFIVNADGSLGEARISRPVDPDLEAEALRIVNMMPNWIPAEKDGKPVDAAVNLPIKFKLPVQGEEVAEE